jgi:DNA polymerase-1
MPEALKLIIIDANSLIHRAYHALPPFTDKQGEPVGAVYGFFSIFFRALKELEPDFIALAFDMAAPTFRHQAFLGYKAKRRKPPDEFYRQIPKIKEILQLFGLPIFEREGFEADDIIGTIAVLAQGKSLETVILSSDNDVLQLVNKTTKALLLRRGITEKTLYDEKAVQEKYQGLAPKQLIDFKALRGDPSDNIPGVFGIGEKTAIKLINQFVNLENLYQEIAKGTTNLKEALVDKLTKQREQAFLSKRLSEIHQNADINFNLESCQWRGYDREKVAEALRKLQFFSLLKRLP